MDTGLGIKDEDKERVFERFYQVQHGDAHDFGGSGIGLHMVKEFVQLHHGDISISDNEGGGSVFVVTIPLVITHPMEEVKLNKSSFNRRNYIEWRGRTCLFYRRRGS